jgi:hypothetical protein
MTCFFTVMPTGYFASSSSALTTRPLAVFVAAISETTVR